MTAQQASGSGGPSEAFRTAPGSDRLLLASHNRLLWYYYNSGKVDVLHEGQVGVRICTTTRSEAGLSRVTGSRKSRWPSSLLRENIVSILPSFCLLPR